MHFDIAHTKMHLEFLGEVSIYLGIGIQIIFAVCLGGLVGYDREVKMKAAGFKTNIMICIGATLYTTMSAISLTNASSVIDPNRVAAQIVSGIGFLGAGAIIQGRGSVTGLTTAATIWVVAAIGYTIGIGYPLVATLFSLTVLAVLRILKPLHSIIENKKDHQYFHFELLTLINAKSTIRQIIKMEQVEVIHFSEELLKPERLLLADVYLKGHIRAIERISHEFEVAIKIKKVNHREVSKEIIDSEKHNNTVSLDEND